MPENFFPESTSPRPAAAPSATRRTLVALAASTPLLAAAAAVLTRRPPVVVAQPVPAVTDAGVESAGYHETDHIRRYYRSAKYF